MKRIATIVAMIVVSVSLIAQEAGTTSPSTSGGMVAAAKVRSPELLPDGRVTFRLYAPKASEVLVVGNFPGGRGLPMSKDTSGLWSVTTSPLQPELWAYTFSVDGVRTLDANNYNVARDGVGFMNTVLVLGDQSAVFQPKRVPHGTMTAMWVPSTGIHTPRRMFVYTPPGYEEGNTRYPVLYLLHGSGGDEDVAYDGHRQRDPGQPDRGREVQAHHCGDAECLLERDRFSRCCRSANSSTSRRGLRRWSRLGARRRASELCAE